MPPWTTRAHGVWRDFRSHLNFFRIHLIFFTFTPLIFSGIFYAVNGSTHVTYIDSLFLCVSALTVCGLATIDLSSITVFQQVILVFLAAIGNPIVVSWVMVYIRKRYFVHHLANIVEAEMQKRKDLERQRVQEQVIGDRPRWRRSMSRVFSMARVPSRTGHGDERGLGPSPLGRTESKRGVPDKFESEGVITEEPARMSEDVTNDANDISRGSTMTMVDVARGVRFANELRRPGDEGGRDLLNVSGPRRGASRMYSRSGTGFSSSVNVIHDDRTFVPPGGIPYRRRASTHYPASTFAGKDVTLDMKNRGLGGFPYPTYYLKRLLRKWFPGLLGDRDQSLAMSRTRSNQTDEKGMTLGQTISYFSESFNAMIGRNSKFHSLTDEHMEELGGVEYRAINALLWLIAVYHFGVQLLCFVILAPYMSISRWRDVFNPPNLHQPVNPVWYTFFQVISVYTTAGLSLVDQAMVPFQEAYPLVFLSTFLILAGNLAYPIALRFFIWAIKKATPSIRQKETLQFLLDHPRRCYTYLFPQRQTIILLITIIGLFAVDYVTFETLSLGIDTFDAIPPGVRVAIGTLQATSVRAAGLVITSISGLAPSLQVLYLVVMYLGVYPIALSVRATNVYEEKSLGVYEEEEEEMEPDIEGPQPGMLGSYLAWHARRQLAFDMWWLGFAVFLACIFERGKITDNENFQWFTIFSLLFEVISAYAGVGMSLGVPYGNFSLSGAFSTVSKLIIIAVMLRGRHRGLPVAIDRAIMLPHEFQKLQEPRESSDMPISSSEIAAEQSQSENKYTQPALIIDEKGKDV